MSTIPYAALAVFLVMASSAQAAESAAEVRSCDVAVYGGTSSGVVAAVEAARSGRSVTLIEPAMHLGGMTASGLGLTDMGNTPSIGGLSREFYHRIWRHYRDEKNWKFTTRKEYLDWHPLHWGFKGSDADRLEVLFTFEPHVAEKVFDDMVREAGVVVLKGERLDLKNGVKMSGGRIEEIRLESGLRVAAKVFIDATYEGDLLALAGVKHIIGREPNSLYGETFNGIHPSHVQPVDPFVTPGNPASGVLPRILPRPPGRPGEGDHRIQPYNFRLCLTDVPENRVAFTQPPGYDVKRYELLGREMLRHKNARPGKSRKIFPVCLLGEEKEGIINFALMPNRKTDCNNVGFASTDLVGASNGWPEADYATRQRIWQEHKDYIQGLLWFACTDERVPESIRAELKRWGYAKDEFTDSDHWPWQIYVREARRMISDYVVNEHDSTGARAAEDPIALASYPADSHVTSYYVDEANKLWIEGGFWDPRTKTFPISYRAIRPKAGECSNLLVSGCVSSSHVAYASLRMEPVFMMLGHAAGAAAALAIEQNSTVQEVDYSRLRQRLLDQKQILDLK